MGRDLARQTLAVVENPRDAAIVMLVGFWNLERWQIVALNVGDYTPAGPAGPARLRVPWDAYRVSFSEIVFDDESSRIMDGWLKEYPLRSDSAAPLFVSGTKNGPSPWNIRRAAEAEGAETLRLNRLTLSCMFRQFGLRLAGVPKSKVREARGINLLTRLRQEATASRAELHGAPAGAKA